MKQTFTLFAALLLTVSVMAQGRSKLSISIAANVATRIQVDNMKYKMDGDELVLKTINPGNHNIKIYQLRSRGGYQNGGNNNSYQLVYNGNINLKPQTQMDIMVNRFGKAFIDEQNIGRQYNDDDDWGDNDNWNNGNNNNNNSYQPMEAQAFDQLKQAIRNENISDSKEKLAKQYIALNYFTAVQVKELVQLFTFESNKVEIAKFAYKYTIDKGNFFAVYSAFTFSSSKEEVMDYIQKNP
jgi:hypothetical protein